MIPSEERPVETRRSGHQEQVYLRALDLNDLERTLKWHNDRDLYRSLVGTFRYVSRSAEEEWLRKLLAYSSTQLGLAICLAETSQHIGNIYLKDIDWVVRQATLDVLIGEIGQRGKGYGQAAMRSLIGHAFEDLSLLRLHLTVLEDNVAAIKLYEKCGFVVEGRFRRHAFKNGQFKDVLAMGLCAADSPLVPGG